jgi:hypothetical protein
VNWRVPTDFTTLEPSLGRQPMPKPKLTVNNALISAESAPDQTLQIAVHAIMGTISIRTANA